MQNRGTWFDATPEEAKAAMDAGEPLRIIDVRGGEEFAQGHVPGAENIPMEELLTDEWALGDEDFETPLWLYCRSGRRSGIVAEHLGQQGYKRVYNFQGVQQWPYGLVTD